MVVNRASGNAAAGIEDALRLLADHRFDVTVGFADDIGAFLHAVEAAIADAGVVVIGGGDGTISAALPVFLRQRAVMGLLPLGTANDFARSLGIPFAPIDAARVIVAGQRRTVDVGFINGRPFVNAATVGLATEVARRHTGERKARLGLLNYPLCWLEALRDHRPFRAQVRYDGGAWQHRCTMLAVVNGRHHGGGMTVAPDAEIDDGVLKIYFVRTAGLLRLLRVLFALRRGTLQRQHRAGVLRCCTVTVTTARPMPVNVDGEVVERTPATFSIRPNVLTVIAPSAADARAMRA